MSECIFCPYLTFKVYGYTLNPKPLSPKKAFHGGRRLVIEAQVLYPFFWKRVQLPCPISDVVVHLPKAIRIKPRFWVAP